MREDEAVVQVLIVDDHALIRDGLKKILSVEPGIKVVGEAANGQDAIEFVKREPVDVVLLDVSMPIMNGIEACREIKKARPAVAVVALTIHDQEEYLFEMIRAGVSGYVLKDISSGKLVETIYGVARGESFIPPKMTAKVLQEFNRLSFRGNPGGLTEREVEVLRLVAAGASNREIASKLFISEKTVKNHMSNIFQKLGVVDRTQAALYAVKQRIVEL
ncbi:MAG: response regulator transcription factor [Bacillota bacterium]